jgi:hypothetical protein
LSGRSEGRDMAEVPRWLELQAQIDGDLWLLDQIRKTVSDRSAMAFAVDVAAGREDALTAEAAEILARLKAARAEFDALVNPSSEVPTR